MQSQNLHGTPKTLRAVPSFQAGAVHGLESSAFRAEYRGLIIRIRFGGGGGYSAISKLRNPQNSIDYLGSYIKASDSGSFALRAMRS